MMRARTSCRPARGLTLVELLVAMAIGLGVMLAAGRLLLVAGSAHAVQADLGAVDDGGRFALELLGRAVRQAGASAAVSIPTQAGSLPPRIAGLDARSLPRSAAALDDPLPDAVNGSDALAVRFPGAGPAPGGDGSVLDCAGFPVAEGEEGWSIFYVGRNAQGEAELRCKYRGAANWSSDAVVAGVDGFQVLYGIDTDASRDGTPNRYLNADAIQALDAAGGGDGAGQSWWKRVVSVRIGLLLHGSRSAPRAAMAGQGEYRLLGTAYTGAGDTGSSLSGAALAPARRERRLFTTTVGLPAQPP